MILPFLRRGQPEPEKRGYTDAVTTALIEAATTPEVAGYVSALEIAAGQLSRAFASATVTGTGAAMFTPRVLATVGRSMVESGQSVWLRRGNTLVWVRDWSIVSPNRYEVNIVGGSRAVPRRSVFLARWNIDYDTGLGISPLGMARQIRTLLARLEASTATEAGAAVGYLLPVPSDGEAGNVEALKMDLADLRGRIAVVETTRGGWGEGAAAPQGDYRLARMGPNFPDSIGDMLTRAQESVLAACGYPIQLVRSEGGAQGQREAWRRYLHGTVAPLGRIVEQAAAEIDRPIMLGWDALFASDIQGRARAFQSMVNGGMEVERAATLSGLLNAE